jgi:hypothetical protein
MLPETKLQVSLVTLRDRLKRDFKIKYEKLYSKGIARQELFAPKVTRIIVPDNKATEK